jgi:hypothetical protein
MELRRMKTYSHLPAGKAPGDYDVGTSELLYYPRRGFEVNHPMAAWVARHQGGSPLRGASWEAFRDPRETTYAKYVALQKAKETFAAGLLEEIEREGVDRELPAAWIDTLSRMLSPLRFPAHGLQMAAAYVGHLAPSGKIAVAAMFQAADEMRRIQRIAYRSAQLRAVRPDFGADGRERWERDPMWQPLREAVERLLVTYDWGEAFTALCLVLKPAIDDVFLVRFAERARRQGDPLLGALLGSLDEDARWHRAWAEALVGVAVAGHPDNRRVLDGWIDRWRPLAERAVDAFRGELDVTRSETAPCT